MESIGSIYSAQGEVTAVSQSGSRVLQKGDPVYEGDSIVTGSGASVELLLTDETILAQGENSKQTIGDYNYDSQTGGDSSLLLDFAEGTFRMVTGQIGKENPEGVSVKSPLVTIGIRGTGMDVEVRDGETKVGCFKYDFTLLSLPLLVPPISFPLHFSLSLSLSLSLSAVR